MKQYFAIMIVIGRIFGKTQPPVGTSSFCRVTSLVLRLPRFSGLMQGCISSARFLAEFQWVHLVSIGILGLHHMVRVLMYAASLQGCDLWWNSTWHKAMYLQLPRVVMPEQGRFRKEVCWAELAHCRKLIQLRQLRPQ